MGGLNPPGGFRRKTSFKNYLQTTVAVRGWCECKVAKGLAAPQLALLVMAEDGHAHLGMAGGARDGNR